MQQRKNQTQSYVWFCWLTFDLSDLRLIFGTYVWFLIFVQQGPDLLYHSLCIIYAQNGKKLTYLIMRIFVAKHVSLSMNSRLFSGVERFSPFPKLINMPTHFVHNAWEENVKLFRSHVHTHTHTHTLNPPTHTNTHTHTRTHTHAHTHTHTHTQTSHKHTHTHDTYRYTYAHS